MPRPRNPVKRSTEESLRIRKEIVARLQQGEKQVAIAADMGVTRQYVQLLNKEIKEAGAEAVATKPSRGAPRYIPLSPQDTKLMRGVMSTTLPRDHGWEGELWTIATVKKWTKAHLDRVFNARRVRYFFSKWGLELGDPPPRDPRTEEAERALAEVAAKEAALAKPALPPEQPASPDPAVGEAMDDDDDNGIPSIEAMEASVAAWRAEQERKRATTTSAAKSRSGTRALHRQPSKKKRRKK